MLDTMFGCAGAIISNSLVFVRIGHIPMDPACSRSQQHTNEIRVVIVLDLYLRLYTVTGVSRPEDGMESSANV